MTNHASREVDDSARIAPDNELNTQHVVYPQVFFASPFSLIYVLRVYVSSPLNSHGIRIIIGGHFEPIYFSYGR